MDGFAQNLAEVYRGRRPNHLEQILWLSVEGCRFCRGSKFVLFHLQAQHNHR